MLTRTSTLLSLLAAASVLTTSASASALDGYQDRRGLMAGVGVGGGVGLVTTDENGEQTGIDAGRKLGFHLSGMLGGGARDRLTTFGEANWWARSVILGDLELQHHHLSFNGVANLFLFDGFYVEGGGGLAYAIFDTQRGGEGGTNFRYQEMGLAAKAGAGFEFFVNSQTAIGMRIGYTRHFYLASGADFDTVAGGITVRWY